jgi:phage shock protein PspC (stress-responsive transcriptional regulator)
VTDRRIAGVAGGLGRHLDVDPTILRVLLVVLCFFGGAGLLLYAALWLLVPEDGREQGALAMRPGTRNVLIVAVGVVALLLALGEGFGNHGFPWPLLVLGGAVVAYLALRDRDDRPSSPVAGPSDPTVSGSAAPGPGAQATPSPSGDVRFATPSGEQPPWAPVPPASEPPPAPPTRRGPLLFGFTLALAALALGCLGLYDVAGGHVLTSAYAALALAVVGVMLVVGSVFGRAGGLVLLGVVVALGLAVTSAVDAVGGVSAAQGRDLRATPGTAAAVHDTYYVPGGRIYLDLSDVRDPAALAGRSVDVGARAGELVVVLPRGVVTDVDAEIAGPGQIDVPGRTTGGFDDSLNRQFGSGPGVLHLRAHLFAGHIDVRNAR